MTASQMNELLAIAGSDYRVSDGDRMWPGVLKLIWTLIDRIEKLEDQK